MGLYFSKPSPDSSLMSEAWCEPKWDENNDMKTELRGLQIKALAVDHLRILVTGPVGAGKSRFIHSIESILQNSMTNAACKVGAAAGKSFTKKFTTNTFKDENGKPLPFVITDVMGLENGEELGAHPEDIISALKGHISEGYTFNPKKPCTEEDTRYNRNPTLNDKVHCLVFVIPAGAFIAAYNDNSDARQKTNAIVGDSLIQKMEQIRREACDLDIPHVVVLTKVDLACSQVRDDTKLIYRSKLIYQKAQACSNTSGIPMSDIFPVRNYDEEKELKSDMNTVLLFTLARILRFANEFVEKNATA